MSWDEEAAGWDQDEATRTYARAAFASLRELCSTRDVALSGATVCDFGCGTGLLTEKLAELCDGIDAVDTSPAMLEVLSAKIDRRQWSHVRAYSELPAGGRYDLVVCSSVCAFLDDYPAAVRDLASHLKPGGLFIQWDWELNPDDEEPYGLTRAQIRECLQAAGLDVLKVDTAFTAHVGDTPMTPLMGAGRQTLSADP